jgi:hypothetical protein
MSDMLEDQDDSPQDRVVFGKRLDATGRVVLAVVALPFGLLSGWMFWIVHNFANGRDWFDLIVRVILDEFILAIGLFALTLLLGAVFAPGWLARVFDAVAAKLVFATMMIVILFVAVFCIVMFVAPVLMWLGIL